MDRQGRYCESGGGGKSSILLPLTASAQIFGAIGDGDEERSLETQGDTLTCQQVLAKLDHEPFDVLANPYN
jgi:hypothetical protein